MEPETIRDERHPDHQEKAQSQHDYGRIRVNEARQRAGREHHDQHRDDDGDHHDRYVIGHADRGNDAVDREYEVEGQYLYYRRAEG